MHNQVNTLRYNTGTDPSDQQLSARLEEIAKQRMVDDDKYEEMERQFRQTEREGSWLQ